MATYTYVSTMPSQSDVIEGVVFQRGVKIDYATDQTLLNQWVPEKLDRYVNGVLANDNLVTPFVLTEQEKAKIASIAGSGTLYATLPLTAVTTPGKRQAVGGAKFVNINAAGNVSIYVKWSNATGALSVSTADTLYPITAAGPVQLTVPSGFPFFEYMLASGGPTFNLGLMV